MRTRVVLCIVLVAAFAVTGCASRSSVAFQPSFQRGQAASQSDKGPPLTKVSKKYRRGCACGVRLSNNCAHYLSNAFIEAGYTELLEVPWITERCKAGRVIRAQDMLKWFQEKRGQFHLGTPPPKSGLWATYQEKPDRRHVLITDTNKNTYYGTDNCLTWPTQWHYQW